MLKASLLVDSGVLADTAEFALEADAAGVVGAGLDGVEGRAALRVRVVVIVAEVACAVVEPAAGRIDESGGVEGVDEVGELELRIVGVADLAPAFIVDHPGDDAGIAAVLADEDFELALEFLLLLGVREDVLHRAVVQCPGLDGPERGHVLDYHQPELITGLIEQRRFDFDLLELSVSVRFCKRPIP